MGGSIEHVTDPTTCYCGAKATHVTPMVSVEGGITFGKVWTCDEHDPRRVGINVTLRQAGLVKETPLFNPEGLKGSLTCGKQVARLSFTTPRGICYLTEGHAGGCVPRD